jgi:hypothetical protein
MPYETYVYRSPPEGFGWQVLKDGKLVKSGLARTEAEAYTTADGVVEELESADAKQK